jgi:hypothetical protein
LEVLQQQVEVVAVLVSLVLQGYPGGRVVVVGVAMEMVGKE